MRRLAVPGVAVVAASMLAACSGAPGGHAVAAATAQRNGGAGRAAATALTRAPAPVTVLPDGTQAELTARFARTLFATAPVVVIAGPTGKALRTAEPTARADHAPLLLAPPDSAGAANAGITSLAAATRALHPEAVLAVGLPRADLGALTADLHGVRVVTKAGALPATGLPAPLSQVAVLVHAPASFAVSAVSVTAQAAGAIVIALPGSDPRTDPAAIAELATQQPRDVVAVGTPFGPAARLASRLAVAETGRQLPGGGQVLFPGRRLVALYGHPGTPGLGVLGQQDLAASLARARAMAAAYRRLSTVPVVPAFEIIATVAEGSPGPDGTYSYATPVAELRPWVRAASAAGLYVVLDLQAGRASLLDQAKRYQSLLKLPGVGLALDPEWRLGPGQKPLKQIGHVDVGEVNGIIGWLAALTADNHLPQKLLVLHQFKLSMISGEQDLDTSHDDLAIVIHMDGQGTPGNKQESWNAVTGGAPRGVRFGWKDFLRMDHPMLTPGETMQATPAPVMISYQ